jgi:LysR family transcriptional regulator, glycine cleavage system transcriptional activator
MASSFPSYVVAGKDRRALRWRISRRFPLSNNDLTVNFTMSIAWLELDVYTVVHYGAHSVGAQTVPNSMVLPDKSSADRKGGAAFSNARRLPPLVMVRAFEAAARTGSMRKASDDIGVSHTVVSRHVRNLEAWAGRKLIVSGPRGVKLTREGEIFFTTVSKAFQMIASATVELRPLSRRRILRIWSVPGLATRWLAPRLSMIEKTLAGAEIVLRAIDRLPDFGSFEADVMIGFGDPPSEAIPLVLPRMFPVASKRWTAENGVPANLAELAELRLIHEESRRQWTEWFEKAGMALTKPLTGPLLWDASLGFDAALAGQGIALASRLTAGDEIESGNVMELLRTDVRLQGYYLLIRPDLTRDPLTLRFRGWIEDHIRRDEEKMWRLPSMSRSASRQVTSAD